MNEYEQKPEGYENTPPPPPTSADPGPPPPHQTPQASGDLGQQFSAATQAPPVPGEVAPQEQRTMGMLCHLLALTALVGIPFGHILGPLIIWLVKKDELAFVDDQGKESLNFQITLTLLGIAVGIVTFIIGLIPVLGWIVSCLLIVAMIGVAIAAVVFVIIAAIKANEGEYYRYPLSVRLIK